MGQLELSFYYTMMSFLSLITLWMRVEEVLQSRFLIQPRKTAAGKASSCSNSSLWQTETLQTEKLDFLLISLAHIFQIHTTKFCFLELSYLTMTRQAIPKNYMMSPLLSIAEDRYS